MQKITLSKLALSLLSMGMMATTAYAQETFTPTAIESARFAGHAVTFTASNDGQNYATLNLPFAATLPAGVTAYKGTVSGNEVILTAYKQAGEVLPANTPCCSQQQMLLLTTLLLPVTNHLKRLASWVRLSLQP